jgi:hypothetical protein
MNCALSIAEEFEARLHSKEDMDNAINQHKNNLFIAFVVQTRTLFAGVRITSEERIEILVAAFLSTYPLTSSTSLELYHHTECPHVRDTILKCTALARSTVPHKHAELAFCIDEELSGFWNE